MKESDKKKQRKEIGGLIHLVPKDTGVEVEVVETKIEKQARSKVLQDKLDKDRLMALLED